MASSQDTDVVLSDDSLSQQTLFEATPSKHLYALALKRTKANLSQRELDRHIQVNPQLTGFTPEDVDQIALPQSTFALALLDPTSCMVPHSTVLKEHEQRIEVLRNQSDSDSIKELQVLKGNLLMEREYLKPTISKTAKDRALKAAKKLKSDELAPYKTSQTQNNSSVYERVLEAAPVWTNGAKDNDLKTKDQYLAAFQQSMSLGDGLLILAHRV